MLPSSGESAYKLVFGLVGRPAMRTSKRSTPYGGQNQDRFMPGSDWSPVGVILVNTGTGRVALGRQSTQPMRNIGLGLPFSSSNWPKKQIVPPFTGGASSKHSMMLAMLVT